jgi:hypothetical protein
MGGHRRNPYSMSKLHQPTRSHSIVDINRPTRKYTRKFWMKSGSSRTSSMSPKLKKSWLWKAKWKPKSRETKIWLSSQEKTISSPQFRSATSVSIARMKSSNPGGTQWPRWSKTTMNLYLESQKVNSMISICCQTLPKFSRRKRSKRAWPSKLKKEGNTDT